MVLQLLKSIDYLGKDLHKYIFNVEYYKFQEICFACYKSPGVRFRNNFLEKWLKWSLKRWIRVSRMKGEGAGTPCSRSPNIKQFTITRALRTQECEAHPSLVLRNFCKKKKPRNSKKATFFNEIKSGSGTSSS